MLTACEQDQDAERKREREKISILISLAVSQQNLYDIYHCCVCSARLLMMDRETVRNIYFLISNNLMH